MGLHQGGALKEEFGFLRSGRAAGAGIAGVELSMGEIGCAFNVGREKDIHGWIVGETQASQARMPRRVGPDPQGVAVEGRSKMLKDAIEHGAA